MRATVPSSRPAGPGRRVRDVVLLEDLRRVRREHLAVHERRGRVLDGMVRDVAVLARLGRLSRRSGQ